MPDFEYSWPKLITSTPWVKAREFINRLIVNPIPQRKDTPRTSYIEILSGNLQILNFIDKYVRELIPIGFPSRSPSIIPSGTLFVRELKLIAFKSISALKKANNGNITNPEKMCSFFSKNFNGEWLLFLTEKGIVAANITPAIVVWTPEWRIKYQRNKPKNKYIEIILTLKKFNIIKATKVIDAYSKYIYEMFSV